jgi:2-polyprenyl-6-methoxyphenol hydroxylase-like FAD-dependent oxidoreductase
MVWGKNCFFGYTVSPDGEIWWFANPPSGAGISRERLRDMTTEQVRQRLLELLSVDKTPGAQIVQSTKEDFGLTNQYDLPTVPTWHSESMVIIGDAAHAVSPSSGQGASLAAEDAVVLAKCLRDLPSIPHALAAYVRLRRTRVERIVKWGSGMNNTKKQGAVGRVLRDLVLPIILKKGSRPEELAKMSWMFYHHIDWDERIEE